MTEMGGKRYVGFRRLVSKSGYDPADCYGPGAEWPVSSGRCKKLPSDQAAAAGEAQTICSRSHPTVALSSSRGNMQNRENRMPQSRKRNIDVPSLSVQATAEVGVLAKYEIRKTITEHIPVDVTRAKTSAWLTILSPFTNWAGLLGDKLAYKRDLLRIQQEESLTAIMRNAAPKLALIKAPIKPIPVKFLVPFLESASLEDPGSELVRMWANLLVSSAEDYNEDNVYYVRLLSQMSSVQARLFEAIVGVRGPRSVLISMEQNFFLGQHFLRQIIEDAFKKAKRPPATLTQAWKILERALNHQGVVIEHIDLGHMTKEDFTNGCPPYSIYNDKQQNDYAILRGLGLLEYVDTGYMEVIKRWNIKVMAHYVTPLGLAFAQACGVQAERGS